MFFKERMILSKHFMLYKEVSLFIIYAILLKGDTKIHEKVKAELTGRLSYGVSEEELRQRDAYWYELSRKFYDEYMRTQNINVALNYCFWEVLKERNPEMVSASDVSNDYGLSRIYRYVYETVSTEKRYKEAR